MFLLTSHRLSHLPTLAVDPVLFEPKFASHCSMGNCNAHCCRDGVWADPTEKARILQHADMIIRHMDPDQEHDPAQWFSGEIEEDPDYPSGHCEGTATRERGCVFLDQRGWCVLQKAAVAEGLNKYALKPYYCVAFPLTISDGVLTVDDPDFTNRTVCCSVVDEGHFAPADVCREELEFMLGDAGMKELDGWRERAQKNA
jgi:Fe-S-cluster containining protein